MTRRVLLAGISRSNWIQAPSRGMSPLGHERTSERGSGMSALPLRADILTICINVCLVPEADIELGQPDRIFVDVAWTPEE